jgi:hypothetical protein
LLATTQFQGRLHSLHRLQHRWIEYFDVALPGYGFGVTQNALNDFIVPAQCEPRGRRGRLDLRGFLARRRGDSKRKREENVIGVASVS